MKKAIFFDIDNTLYSHFTHSVPKSTMDALRTLKSKNKLLYIATSRSKAEMVNVPKDVIALMDGIITLGGARIDEHGQTIITHPIDSNDLHTLVQFIQEHGLTARYCGLDDCVNDLNQDDDEIKSRFQRLYDMVPPVKPYQWQPLIHVLFYCNDDRLIGQIASRLNHSTFTILKTSYEVTGANVTKGHAIDEVMKYHGLRLNESVAFGDSNNDVEMLKMAGIGIAMGNADANIRRVADYTTTHIDQDGIYNACVHFNWFE